MADAAPAMALALVDGRAVLTVVGRDLGPVLVERLEVEWPGARNALAIAQLRNRRGRLRVASLIIDRARIDDRIAARGPAAGELGVALEPGRMVLSGNGNHGGAEAFSARLSLGPGEGRKLRVSVDGQARPDDVRSALAAVFGAPAAGDAAFEVDPLGTALDEIFVADGFRLPESRDLRLGAARVSAGRIALRWSTGAEPGPVDGAIDDADEIAALRRALDMATPGRSRSQVAHLLATAYEKIGQEEGALAALQICIDQAIPGPLVGTAWRRLIELLARRGDPHAAARALIASADDARVAATDVERAGALVAAAEILRKRLGLPGDAGMLLERAVTLDPASAEALGALEALSRDAGDFRRLAEILERKLEVVARGPREQTAILTRLAEIYEQSLGQPARARDTHERLLKIDPAQAGAAADLARGHGKETTRAPRPTPPQPPRTATLPPPPPPPPAPAPGATGAPDGHFEGENTEATGAPEGQFKGESTDKYWRAAGVESEPMLRANTLVAKARVSLSRGEFPTATDDLEQALASAPRHAGALLLLAEIAYRKQEWQRARELYAALEQVPDATEAVSRADLVARRAALAQRLGEGAEAEALYRELAILNPRHVEARRVLAELALARGDTATAALRLEELLRLLPAGASADLVDLRHRLGAVYAETGEWNGARYYLELVVDQEPSRLPALELLAQTYQKLSLHREAAETCGRLARLYPDPSHRAAVLYRQAEIRRTHLEDEAGAIDAYLRSSDADPHFVPARLRLVDHFWAEGDLDVVADLAGDLAAVPLSTEGDADLMARLAIALAGPRSAVPARFALGDHPDLLDAAVRVLAQAGERAATCGSDTIDPLLTRARFWAGPEGEAGLVSALVELVQADPARSGPVLVLGGLAARMRRLPLARAAYSLAAFVHPEGLANKLLDALPAPDAVRPEAVRPGTPVDHPDVAGPVRRALSRLAPALLGLDYHEPAPKPVEGSGLPPARAIELRRIADLLGAPPFVVAPDAEGLRRTPAPRGERRRLRLIPSQPAGLLISPAAVMLSPLAWSFVAGRAIEALRSGLVTAGLTGVDGLTRLLEGARAALGGAASDEPRARVVADWLARPEAFVTLGSPEARAELLADVEAALSALPDWKTFRRGTRHTCNRIGLLVCGSPVDMLSVISEGELYGDDDEPPTPAVRGEFLRSESAREIVSFMLSPAYEAAAAS
ncbi:MAG TPA: tetratricopeptide repeat protein [Polyangia bacterium]|nr:tetratricopeptide repeat protein [Polyangia bacterium]